MSNDPHFEVYPQMRDMEPVAVSPGAERVSEQAAPGQEPTGEFGWRFRAANGQISAVSGEGFTSRSDARRAVKDFLHTAGRCADRFGDHDEPIIDVDR